LTTVRGVIQEITGLRLHYTTVINLDGFESLVDAMGGVTVTINEKLPIGGHLNSAGQLVGVDAWIQPGTQHLDGYHALWFARSRLASDDYNRMRRQRCLVGKILDPGQPSLDAPEVPRAGPGRQGQHHDQHRRRRSARVDGVGPADPGREHQIADVHDPKHQPPATRISG
jgi:hypothetical protein